MATGARPQAMPSSFVFEQQRGPYKIMVLTRDDNYAFNEEFSIIALPETGESLSPVPRELINIPSAMAVRTPNEVTGSYPEIHPLTGRPHGRLQFDGQLAEHRRTGCDSRDSPEKKRAGLGIDAERSADKDGTQRVELRENIQPGRYIIRVQTRDNRVKGESPALRLAREPTSPFGS